MALGTLASRVTGFVRTAVIASAIGATIGDAYNLANTLPNIVYELLLGGVLTSVVVPLLVEGSRREGRDRNAYAQRMLTLVTITLAIASLAAILLAPWIVRLYSLFGTHGLPKSKSRSRHCRPLLSAADLLLWRRRHHGRHPQHPLQLCGADVVTGAEQPGRHRDRRHLPGRNHGLPQAGALTRLQWLVLSIGTTLGIVAQTVALVPALRATGFHLVPVSVGTVPEWPRLPNWLVGFSSMCLRTKSRTWS